MHVVLDDKYDPKLLLGFHALQLSFCQYPGSVAAENGWFLHEGFYLILRLVSLKYGISCFPDLPISVCSL